MRRAAFASPSAFVAAPAVAEVPRLDWPVACGLGEIIERPPAPRAYSGEVITSR